MELKLLNISYISIIYNLRIEADIKYIHCFEDWMKI